MSGAIAKLSAKAIEKAVAEVSKEQQFTSLPEDGSPFQKMLDSVSEGQEFAAKLGVDNQAIGMQASGVQAISAEGIPIDTANFATGMREPEGINKVVDMLSEVNKGQMQMETMVNEILYSGKKFSNQELLAIQAHVFHFAQVTELVVKTADQGVSSIKSLLNTNIQ